MNDIRRNYTLDLDLQMFAEGDEGDPNPDGGKPEPDPEPPKKLELTQEEFDAKIAERLARERRKYADYDEVKTKLTALEQAEEERKKAEMSESDRLKAEVDAATKRAEEAEGKSQTTIEAANQRLIRAEFRMQAKEAGIRSDALDDAYTLADKSAVKVGDDGAIEGVDDVIKALIDAKPFLVESTEKKPRNIGGGNNPDEKPEKTKEQLLAAAAEKARKSGRIEDRLAYAELKEELSK